MNEHYGAIASLLDEYIDQHDVTFEDLTNCLKMYIKSIGRRIVSRVRPGDDE